MFPLDGLVEGLGADANSFATAEESDPEPIRASRAEIVGLLYGRHVELVTPRDTVATVADRLVALVHRLCAVSPAVLRLEYPAVGAYGGLGGVPRLHPAVPPLPPPLVVARP